MPRQKKPRKVFNDHIDGCRIVRLPQDGDCFYAAVSMAFASDGLSSADCADEAPAYVGEAEVARLRRCVSRRVDGDVFDTFKMLHGAGLDDFSFMRRIPDAAALRTKLCVSGAESGTNRCVWANDFEITALCEALGVVALIVDGEASDAGRFVALPPRSCWEDDAQARSYVVLLRSERHHFDLGEIDERSLFRGLGGVPKRVRRAFALPAPDPSCAVPEVPRRRGPAPPPPPPDFSCPACARSFASQRARAGHLAASKPCRKKLGLGGAAKKPAAALKRPRPTSRAFRAYEEKWERSAVRRREPAAEARLLEKYAGLAFTDGDAGATFVVSDANLEWFGNSWTVLCKPPAGGAAFESYVINAELRRMIAATAQPSAVKVSRKT